ncbi:hypothetical protein HBO22_26310 [Pseudomonas gessardii]|nr:hypothetical protein [Pseudomonas gessardii]
MCKIVKGDGVTAEFLPEGDVFQQLGYGFYAMHGRIVQNVEWSLSVDQQGGDCAVVAGKGHESIHLKISFYGAENDHSLVAKREGGSCTQVGEPETSNRQTRGSPAHSRHNSDSAGAKEFAKESKQLLHSLNGSPNPIAI